MDKKISEFGFKEAKKKPDLFYKNIDNKIILFFDFRVHLGEFYPHPHNRFYFKINKELTQEEKSYYNKIIINEFFNVVKKIREPVDFDNLFECDVCKKKFIEEFGFSDWEYDEGGFACSEKCLKIIQIETNKIRRKIEERKVKRIFNTYEITRKALECPICKEKPKIKSDFSGITLEYKRHNHHIDYNTDKTIVVCPSCHTKITFHLDKYPELKKYKPIGDRKDMLKKLEEKEKKKREEKLKKRKEKEFQKMTLSRGMKGHRDGKWRYSPPYKSRSPMLGAWLK
ncbi:hypothetical protein ES703_89075 [subsurface metagenome]